MQTTQYLRQPLLFVRVVPVAIEVLPHNLSRVVVVDFEEGLTPSPNPCTRVFGGRGPSAGPRSVPRTRLRADDSICGWSNSPTPVSFFRLTTLTTLGRTRG